ncbi:MAG: alpha/beta hydrolase [Rhodanobacteraceae bacterium]|nr:alpha/beta hydrolase [Rhodanobacteraceae bacterium]
MYLNAGGENLFAVLQRPIEAPRQAYLLCPPMLHEHPRSHRLFALLAQSLATHGIASLRFDYAGSGDSSGDSQSLDLDSADTDAEFALAHLRQLLPDIPVTIMGIRAGALIAAPLARLQQLPLVLWQPVHSGAQWLQVLQRRDSEERRSTRRFPFQRSGTQRPVAAGSLMGFRLGPTFSASIYPRTLAELPADCIVLDRSVPEPIEPVRNIPLPAALADWADQIDISAPFPAQAIAEIAATLAQAGRSAS